MRCFGTNLSVPFSTYLFFSFTYSEVSLVSLIQLITLILVTLSYPSLAIITLERYSTHALDRYLMFAHPASDDAKTTTEEEKAEEDASASWASALHLQHRHDQASRDQPWRKQKKKQQPQVIPSAQW